MSSVGDPQASRDYGTDVSQADPVIEPAAPTGNLLDVRTGELLEPTTQNAIRALVAARDMKQRINDVVYDATQWLVEESARLGTKTLHDEQETVTLTGGKSVDYDPAELRDALTVVGCPASRIDDAVKVEVTYKVDRRVLRQLAAANPEYKRAIEAAEIEVGRPYRATVKLRRQRDN